LLLSQKLKRKPQLKEAEIGTLDDDISDEEGETFPAVGQISPEYSVHCGAVIIVIQLVIKTDLDTLKRYTNSIMNVLSLKFGRL
jgi:hypothetical protein